MADDPDGEGRRPGRRSKAKPVDRTNANGKDASIGATAAEGPVTTIPAATSEVAAVPVVGIGASAGGIEALGRFFDVMPPDSACAFVFVLHLDR